ncbi:MAG: SUMF1/EgtB/PvdO family nonheme iron enzyme [Sedimentisphaerales bacterium]|nr:SUMF1/EgtB/PvdO family nonheme iron enzyme [Sedimentisphaerales bacterium]
MCARIINWCDVKLLTFIGFWLLLNFAVFGNGTEFVAIPAGSYQVTDGATKKIKLTVSVSEFLISKTEVTQKQFSQVIGYNPSYYKGDNRPVEQVSWWEAIRYCNLRSVNEDMEPCYNLSTGKCDFSKNAYRLPTEAEWSIAGSDVNKLDMEDIEKYANLGVADTTDSKGLMHLVSQKGTKEVSSYPANKFGLYDMCGNVWEWCYDYYNTLIDQPSPLINPTGPLWGPERVICGGCFVTTPRLLLDEHWRSITKAGRRSLRPDDKSLFTGFRICRSSLGRDKRQKKTYATEWFEPFNRIPKGLEGLGRLRSFLIDEQGSKISTVAQWQRQRRKLKEKWMKLLGAPTLRPPLPAAKLIKTFQEEYYTGKLMYLQTEPDDWMKILIMIPHKPIKSPTPVVISPYYDVDAPAGKNLGGQLYNPPSQMRSFCYLMVQQGYIGIAVQGNGMKQERYDEAVAHLKLKYPECTGLGKWVWNVHRLVDYLYTLPEVDHHNIGVVGHSYGGTMSLYAAALDDRITTVVDSEGAISFYFTNYYDYWYFGDYIRDIAKSTDQHELLALIAPRPFLLISGEWADGDKSWSHINAAREVYSLLSRPECIGMFNHRSGHSPTPEAFELLRDWFVRFLDVEMNTSLAQIDVDTSQGEKRIAANVNDASIYEVDVQAHIASRFEELSRWGSRMPRELIGNYKHLLRGQILDEMINKILLEQELQTFVKTPTEAQKSFLSLSLDEVRLALDACGQSFEGLVADDDQLTEFRKLFEAVFKDKLTVSVEEAKQYYDNNIDLFTAPQELSISHILIKPDINDPNTQIAKVKAKEKAEKLLEKLRAGADFAELAKLHSDCLSTGKIGGGYINRLRRHQKVPAFEDAAFELKDGEISDIVETEFGYHIIKLRARKPAEVDPFEQVKPKAVKTMRVLKIKKLAKEYINSIRDKAEIHLASEETQD